MDINQFLLNAQRLSTCKSLTGPAVLFFFVPWCVSYVKQTHPTMSAECRTTREAVFKAEKQLGKQLSFLAVASRYSNDEAGARRYQEQLKVRFPIAFDAENQLFSSYKVNRFPTVIVVGQDGQVKARFEGAQAELTQKLTELF